MTVKRMDNVGIVVEDIDAAIEFFTQGMRRSNPRPERLARATGRGQSSLHRRGDPPHRVVDVRGHPATPRPRGSPGDRHRQPRGGARPCRDRPRSHRRRPDARRRRGALDAGSGSPVRWRGREGDVVMLWQGQRGGLPFDLGDDEPFHFLATTVVPFPTSDEIWSSSINLLTPGKPSPSPPEVE